MIRLRFKSYLVFLVLLSVLFVSPSKASDIDQVKRFYFNASGSEKIKFWTNIASEVNKLVPYNVDSGTILFLVSPRADGLIFNYRLVNNKASDLSSKEWNNVLEEIIDRAKNTFCTSPEVAIYRELDATLQLAYYGNDQKFIVEKVIEVGKECSNETTSTFKELFLGEGITVEIPSHWNLLSEDTRQNLNAAGESLLNKATGESLQGNKRTLLAVNAPPEPTGAMIRISITEPYEITQSDLQGLKGDELREFIDIFTGEVIKMNKKLEFASGGKIEIISQERVKIEKINNLYAINLTYRRAGADEFKNQWTVAQYQIPYSGKLVIMTLSYRESDGFLFKPILEKVKSSLRIN